MPVARRLGRREEIELRRTRQFAGPDAEQPNGRVRLFPEPLLQQLCGGARQRRSVLRRGPDCVLTRICAEIAAADLDDDPSGQPSARTHSLGHAVAQSREFRVQPLAADEIGCERLFRGDAFLIPIRDYWAIVDAGRACFHQRYVRAEYRAQYGVGRGPQLLQRSYAQRLQAARGLGAYAEQTTDRQRIEQRSYFVGPHYHQAVRLAQIRGDLRNQLVWRYAYGCGEAGALAYTRLDLRADAGGLA